MQLPRYTNTGTGKIPDIEKCLRDICNFLPSLQVMGDNRTTSVSRRTNGTIVKAIPQNPVGMLGSPGQAQATPYWRFSVDMENGRVKNVYINGRLLQSKRVHHSMERKCRLLA